MSVGGRIINESNENFDVVHFTLSNTVRSTLVGKQALLKLWICKPDFNKNKKKKNENEVSVQVYPILSDPEAKSKLGQRITADVDSNTFRETWFTIDIGLMISDWSSNPWTNFRSFGIAVRVVDRSNNEVNDVVEITPDTQHPLYLEILED